MFRGGDYYDDPNFYDLRGRNNKLDVSDINLSPKRNRLRANGETIMNTKSHESSPAAGMRLRPESGKRFLREVFF